MILKGDCREVLKAIKDCSIDTIITDPPYGLSFMGKKWDYDVPSVDLWKECLRVLKPGGTALIFAGSRTQHRMACNVEDAGFILKDTIMWLYGSGFPKATDISKQIDKMNGNEREVVGVDDRYKGKKPNVNAYAQDKWTQENWKREIEITKPAGNESTLWNGWKSHGLKPAYEPILIAVKPNEGSYAQNALKWGVSGLWIDGGRIDAIGYTTGGKNNSIAFGRDLPKQERCDGSQGRYPANLILDEEAGRLLDQQSGVSKSSGGSGILSMKTAPNDIYGKYKEGYKSQNIGGLGDIGGASRFFYTAKASKGERGENNNHPTVKPIKLMEYLCKLTKTPTGGIVLDPFMGSGTTGIACILTGRDFIGIEKEQEYIDIAKARIKHFKSNISYQLELQEAII